MPPGIMMSESTTSMWRPLASAPSAASALGDVDDREAE